VLTGVRATSNGGDFTVSILSGETYTVGGLTMNASTGAAGVATAATVQLTNGTLNAGALVMKSGVGAAANSTIIGYGNLGWTSVTPSSQSVSNAPIIEASGGTLNLTSNITTTSSNGSNTLNYEVAATSVLNVEGTVAGTKNPFTFLSSSSGELEFANETLTVTVAGLNVGSNLTPTNFIDVVGTATASINENTGATPILTVTDTSGTQTFNLTGISGTYYAKALSDVSGGTEIFLSSQACYALGTRILTPRGEVAVEDLAEGDQVVTLAGDQHVAETVAWVGYRKVNLAAHPRPELVAPVQIRRDAFGTDMPRRDLFVSPDHAIFVDGKLVVARLLVNHMSITQEFGLASVEYYHVELPRHAVLLADGLPAESYLDTGNRATFSNAGLALVLHPEFGASHGVKSWAEDACAPLATEAAEVEPMWRRLASRAESLGYEAPRLEITSDPDLHIMADGRRIRPISAGNGRHVFVLPGRVDSMRLVSRADAPTDIAPYMEDRRRLGVAVNRLILRRGSEQSEIPMDYPTLSRGWHAVEREGHELRRWTDGDADLTALFEAGADLTVLEVYTSCVRVYRQERSPVACRLVA
jgi:hypothetical protein